MTENYPEENTTNLGATVRFHMPVGKQTAYFGNFNQSFMYVLLVDNSVSMIAVGTTLYRSFVISDADGDTQTLSIGDGPEQVEAVMMLIENEFKRVQTLLGDN